MKNKEFQFKTKYPAPKTIIFYILPQIIKQWKTRRYGGNPKDPWEMNMNNLSKLRK